jgi:hypothetical protein
MHIYGCNKKVLRAANYLDIDPVRYVCATREKLFPNMFFGSVQQIYNIFALASSITVSGNFVGMMLLVIY